ncbi:hypothetical protein [Sphingobacterium sp. JB170]|uniref:hypothetical protein n=1 Tax=Sphingobacterium sp. JB170 TaxID=1434842 RepID=UPI00097E88DC|nr:hypothetical protein [Sphingobacterium sp. JB170]SJN42709.1 hypothetical protein FM107_11745 [Sphingobacterium sp. JB170]
MGITKDTRDDIMNEIVLRSKTEEIKEIVIVGQNLDKGHYPYSVIAGDLDTNLFNPLSLE